MGQHRLSRLRTCLDCGAQTVADADGIARHACAPDGAYMRRRRRGRCVRCGKPSLPYVLCESHRFESNLKRLLDRGARYGLFLKSTAADRMVQYAIGDETAKVGQRGFYKKYTLGGAPRGFFPFVQAYLQQQGRPMHKDSIVGAFTSYRRDRAARGHLESLLPTPPGGTTPR